MLQTLFYIPPSFFGFGYLFVLLLAGTAGTLLVPQLRKRTTLTSVISTFVIFAVVITYVLPKISEVPRGVPIRGYGVCLVIAIFAALFLVVRLAKRRNIPAESVYTLCLWAVVSGILGARIFYVTEYWKHMVIFDQTGTLSLSETLFNLVNIANGGLVVFGSIIGGIAGSLVFIWRNKLPVLATFDAMAPALMLGISIGRVGCFLNGCCFGSVCDLPWAVTFPPGSPAHVHQIEHGDVFFDGLKFQDVNGNPTIAAVQSGSSAERAGLKAEMPIHSVAAQHGIDGKPTTVWTVPNVQELTALLQYLYRFNPNGTIRFDIVSDTGTTGTKPFYVATTPLVLSHVLPVHPTQLYSSAAALCICGLLLMLGQTQLFRNRDGLVFGSFLVIYSVTRFCLEIIRTDEESFFGTGLTVSQNIALVAGTVGAVLVVQRLIKGGKNIKDVFSTTEK
jgi:phosphatidylglycerol:prolipoprotein diacylglycerol transferase